MYTEYRKKVQLKNKGLRECIEVGIREMSCEDARWLELGQVHTQCEL